MAESEAKEEKRLTHKFAHQKGSLLPSMTTFLVRASTPFAKIFKAWREKENVGAGNAFRFLFDGKLVSPDDMPKMLEMEDGMQIDVQLEQVGGGGQ